jgi:hypothetical protein
MLQEVQHSHRDGWVIAQHAFRGETLPEAALPGGSDLGRGIAEDFAVFGRVWILGKDTPASKHHHVLRLQQLLGEAQETPGPCMKGVPNPLSNPPPFPYKPEISSSLLSVPSNTNLMNVEPAFVPPWSARNIHWHEHRRTRSLRGCKTPYLVYVARLLISFTYNGRFALSSGAMRASLEKIR